MTLQECYKKMGGDYTEVMKRLVKEERIAKYVVKFLEDPTYEALCQAMAKRDFEAVFLAIHTLKGVSQNLGFGALYEASHKMTEAVRGGKELQEMHLFEAVSQAYQKTASVIREYVEE